MGNNQDYKDKPLEYEGYQFLNKPVFFKGGLPGTMVMMIFCLIVLSFIILINLTNIIITAIFVAVIILAMFNWAKKIAKENRKGDRDYLKSSNAWSKSSREIRDNGLLKKLIDNEDKFDI